ncbi:MAG: PQQ-binding-like beta-propeller repeat protein [Verrucomicrobia bacterium]|nr:PQQ-binding-like beta-propeller repeat protein [Verrucomicrobiota bacterium]
MARSTPTDRAWCTSGGDNSRRGAFPRAVRLAAAPPARTLGVSAAVHASVVFDDAGRAFVADMRGGVEAFGRGGGRLWRRRLAGGISASPAVDVRGQRLFVGTHAGWVYALEAATGALTWKRELPSEGDARILSDVLFLPGQDAVVLSSWGGRYVRLAAGTGHEEHAWDGGTWPQAGAAADERGTVYCVRAVANHGVQLLRVAPTGEASVLHEQRGRTRPAQRLLASASPVIDSGRGVVYAVANEDREAVLHAWSVGEGRIAWSRRFACCVGATPAVAWDGTIIVADLGGWVHGVTPDGTCRWRYATGGEYVLAGAVCDRDGTVFLGDPLGVVHAIGEGGAGTTVGETPGAIQGRPALDGEGNLHVPATDRRVLVFANQAR